METIIMGYIGFVLLVDGSGEHRPILGSSRLCAATGLNPFASSLRLRLHGGRAWFHSNSDFELIGQYSHDELFAKEVHVQVSSRCPSPNLPEPSRSNRKQLGMVCRRGLVVGRCFEGFVSRPSGPYAFRLLIAVANHEAS